MVQNNRYNSGQDYLEFFAPEESGGEPGWYWWPCSHGCIPEITTRGQPTVSNPMLDYRKPTYTYKYDHQLYGAPEAPSQSGEPDGQAGGDSSSAYSLDDILSPAQVPAAPEGQARLVPPATEGQARLVPPEAANTLPLASRLQLPQLSSGLQDLRARLSSIKLPQLPGGGTAAEGQAMLLPPDAQQELSSGRPSPQLPPAGQEDVVEGQFRVLPPDSQQESGIERELPALQPAPVEAKEPERQAESGDGMSPPPTAAGGGASAPPPDAPPPPSGGGDTPPPPPPPTPPAAPKSAAPSPESKKKDAKPEPKKKDDGDGKKKDKKRVGGYDESDIESIARAGMQPPVLNIAPRETAGGETIMASGHRQRGRSLLLGKRNADQRNPQRVNIEIR